MFIKIKRELKVSLKTMIIIIIIMGIREMNDRIQIVQKTMKMISFKKAAAKNTNNGS